MNYEKAYKEALERAREIKRTYPQDKVSETIFPILRESKDERIRKILIRYFDSQYRVLKDFTNADITAWLEKQG